MIRLSQYLLIVAVLSPIACAEQRWEYEESVDDINNTKVRSVTVVSEDTKSGLVLRVEEGKKPTLTLVPSVVLFPDHTHVESKTMGVQITMRSTAMEKPVSGMWRMPWMNYKSATANCKRDSAVNKVFAGDSITLQLDKTGKRFKFPTKGKGLEGLQDSVAKAVEIAAPDLPAKDSPTSDE